MIEMGNNQPGLFGLIHSNRDFTLEKSWGKNQFNSAFPVALCCYLYQKQENAIYLAIKDQKISQTNISIADIFRVNPLSSNTFFAFESAYSPFQKYVIGTLPRTDVVILNCQTDQCLSGLEVKLTALPDNTTCELDEKQYGCEIVVRPDSIVYLACSAVQGLDFKTLKQIMPQFDIEDWSQPSKVLNWIDSIVKTIQELSLALEEKQSAFLLQPIWKTEGKSSKLSEHCLDVFVWSDAGFMKFISEIASADPKATKITRQTRTVIWLFKMLQDLAKDRIFDHHTIIDELSYNTKNDKAFASSGNITNPYMSCPRLEMPIIKKNEIKNIILNGGQNLLSPERRFDAILYNSPELFQCYDV